MGDEPVIKYGIIGTGGLALLASDIVMAQAVGVCVDCIKIDKNLNFVDLCKRLTSANIADVFVAISDNHEREMMILELQRAGFGLPPLVHPTAVIGEDAEIGCGSMVHCFSYIGNGAKIGRGVLIHSHCLVDHNSSVGDWSTLSPGVLLTGGVKVAGGATLHTGTIVIPKKVVGPNAITGAGSVVIRDVPEGTTVKGVPAK